VFAGPAGGPLPERADTTVGELSPAIGSTDAQGNALNNPTGMHIRSISGSAI